MSRAPHLKLKKRTRQIADSKEVLVSHTADGQPIWTTVGENRMTDDNKAELSSNLAAHKHMVAVQQAAQQVFQASEIFAETTITGLVELHAARGDADALNAMHSFRGLRDDNGNAFLAWARRFRFRQDGLTGILFDKDSEVARFTAKVDSRLKAEVEAFIWKMQND